MNSPNDIVSQGDKYISCPFTLTMPFDKYGEHNYAVLKFDNAIPQVPKLLSFQESPLVDVKIISPSHPDTIEMEYPSFELYSATITEKTITARLGFSLEMSNLIC